MVLPKWILHHHLPENHSKIYNSGHTIQNFSTYLTNLSFILRRIGGEVTWFDCSLALIGLIGIERSFQGNNDLRLALTDWSPEKTNWVVGKYVFRRWSGTVPVEGRVRSRVWSVPAIAKRYTGRLWEAKSRLQSSQVSETPRGLSGRMGNVFFYFFLVLRMGNVWMQEFLCSTNEITWPKLSWGDPIF